MEKDLSSLRELLVLGALVRGGLEEAGGGGGVYLVSEGDEYRLEVVLGEVEVEGELRVGSWLLEEGDVVLVRVKKRRESDEEREDGEGVVGEGGA